MLKRLYPTATATSIHTINFDKLWQKGIRGLIIDIDNTLETFDIPKPSEPTAKLIQKLKAMDYKICLLSNNSRGRVEKFNADLGCDMIWNARKPSKSGIKRALGLLELKPDKVVLIGDQIFTDCFGGNRMGIVTILTTPIAQRDEW
ncbi:MAG: YqeG family HAD IIIA-type phosphatase, partial [Defluviitaleaceae bacterium]|nr:YqeG family HAD IIIA-type phosphatase [Defluviitaleaceae bacterium]